MSGSHCGAHCTSLVSSHWSYKGGSLWKMLRLGWQRRQVLLEVEWKDYMEKEEKRMVELASQLSPANWQQRTPSCVCGEHSETLHVLTFLIHDGVRWSYASSSRRCPERRHKWQTCGSYHRQQRSWKWCLTWPWSRREGPSASPLQKLDLRCRTEEWNIFSPAHRRSRIPPFPSVNRQQLSR